MTDFYDRCPGCGGLVRRGSACQRCAAAVVDMGAPSALGPDWQVQSTTAIARPTPFRMSVYGSGVLVFVLSLLAACVGLGFLIYGVAGEDGFIRLAHIYVGLGVLLLAIVLALWNVAEQLARFAKHWRMGNDG